MEYAELHRQKSLLFFLSLFFRWLLNGIGKDFENNGKKYPIKEGQPSKGDACTQAGSESFFQFVAHQKEKKDCFLGREIVLFIIMQDCTVFLHHCKE